jgi:YD repeat-containing protein
MTLQTCCGFTLHQPESGSTGSDAPQFVLQFVGCISCDDSEQDCLASDKGCCSEEAVMDAVLQMVQDSIPDRAASSPGMNITSGNLYLRLRTPPGGTYDPRIAFTYNSRAASENIGFGYGVADALNPTVTVTSETTARVVDGGGFPWLYTNKDGNGKYQSPSGTSNSLVQHTDGTFTEMQRNGFELRYDDSGELANLATPAGAVWTILRSSGLVRAIIDPIAHRTSYVYAGGSLKRVVDAYNRITTFTVDGSGELARVIEPDGAITSLLYDANHRLTTYIDPLGNRTSYTYDTIDRVLSLQEPTGSRYTWVYGVSHVAIDPAGGRTTVAYDPNLKLNSVTNPLGYQSHYVWDDDDRLAAFQDAKGNRTSFTYTQLSNRSSALASIEYPLGNTYAFGYANDNLVTTIDPRGNATTTSTASRSSTRSGTASRRSSMQTGFSLPASIRSQTARATATTQAATTSRPKTHSETGPPTATTATAASAV